MSDGETELRSAARTGRTAPSAANPEAARRYISQDFNISLDIKPILQGEEDGLVGRALDVAASVIQHHTIERRTGPGGSKTMGRVASLALRHARVALPGGAGVLPQAVNAVQGLAFLLVVVAGLACWLSAGFAIPGSWGEPSVAAWVLSAVAAAIAIGGAWWGFKKSLAGNEQTLVNRAGPLLLLVAPAALFAAALIVNTAAGARAFGGLAMALFGGIAVAAPRLFRRKLENGPRSADDPNRRERLEVLGRSSTELYRLLIDPQKMLGDNVRDLGHDRYALATTVDATGVSELRASIIESVPDRSVVINWGIHNHRLMNQSAGLVSFRLHNRGENKTLVHIRSTIDASPDHELPDGIVEFWIRRFEAATNSLEQELDVRESDEQVIDTNPVGSPLR